MVDSQRRRRPASRRRSRRAYRRRRNETDPHWIRQYEPGQVRDIAPSEVGGGRGAAVPCCCGRELSGSIDTYAGGVAGEGVEVVGVAGQHGAARFGDRDDDGVDRGALTGEGSERAGASGDVFG